MNNAAFGLGFQGKTILGFPLRIIARGREFKGKPAQFDFIGEVAASPNGPFNIFGYMADGRCPNSPTDAAQF